MKKKIIVLGIAFIMLFTAFAFMGAQCVPPNAELLARIEALERELYELRNSSSTQQVELLGQIKQLQDEINRLEDELDDLGAEKQGIIEGLQGQIVGLLNIINANSGRGYSECGRFAFRIWLESVVVRSTELHWGHSPRINRELTNLTTATIRISVGVGGYESPNVTIAAGGTFELTNTSILIECERFHSNACAGIYEGRSQFLFWRLPNNPEFNELIHIYSNTVLFVVR